ncbi:ATP-dependent Lon protease [Rossellomorea vietnamensis]|uniref:ATP-dependent Lon protease n=1 Tax=Rossellomorea vietnamensis TaxID=218284 RepID=A0A6I6UV60_9BACI|nr:ATP-dependent Lon protease [Rossellomorea vietnamensis]QHE62570.1 ATP-dependent Lon protease [Rossellomorea vietnamensis]
MKLFLSIFFSGLLGILVFFGPIGIYILCAIIVGVIFRAFVLIHDIHKELVPVGSRDSVKEVYEKYLKEKEQSEERSSSS